MQSYFIITNSDGDTKVEKLTRSELLERLKPDEDGNHYYGDGKFLEHIYDNDTNYWNNDMLIIKGEIAVPLPIDVIKGYDI